MSDALPIITVTLNPAIDQTLSIANFAAGKVNRVMGSQMHAAGKGVNVAAMLADLGAPVLATGFLGQDNAYLFEALFAKKKITDRFVRLLGSTRIGVKVVDSASNETTDINFPGLAPTEDEVASLQRTLEKEVSHGQWVVLSGSVPAGMDESIYATLTKIVHERGGCVLLDTSGAPLKAALRAGPNLVKPNVAELSELMGCELDSPAIVAGAARATLLGAGASRAIVSMGGEGAVFVDRDRALLVHPPKVAVKSTVGAGDAMVAGLVFAQQQGMSLEETARLATALGSYAVTRVGSGMESAKAYEGLLSQVRVEALNK